LAVKRILKQYFCLRSFLSSIFFDCAVAAAVFLFCWVPFFTVNIVNAVCIRYEACDDDDNGSSSSVQSMASADEQGQAKGQVGIGSSDCSSSMCNVDPLLLSCFVWLGYINSALNPVIYTIFNVEFRQVFKRMLTRRPCVN
jgi:dopamine receptor D2